MPLEDIRSDVHSLLPGRSTEAGATRRTALQAALGLGTLGYAAAAAPLMAQTAISWLMSLYCAGLPWRAYSSGAIAR